MSLGIFSLYQLKEVMHETMRCFIPEKRPLINQIHLENERNACMVH